MPDPELHSASTAPSEEFGVNQGMALYKLLINNYPEYADEPITYTATRAIRFAEDIAQPKFFLDKDMAVDALIRSLDAEVPATKGVSLRG